MKIYFRFSGSEMKTLRLFWHILFWFWFLLSSCEKKATFENKVIQVLDHVQASVGLQYQWGNIMND